MKNLKIINPDYLKYYKAKQKMTLAKHFRKIKESSNLDFTFSFIRSSVYSSMIEGNRIDVPSYLRNKESGAVKTKSIKEIDDLIEAYKFSKENKITFKNVLRTHKILSPELPIEKKYMGALRDKPVKVFNEITGATVYVGCSENNVREEIEKLFHDISILIKSELSITEIFFYASMIHLVFVKIHPFADGNGRTSRLLEKWFLAKKLGDKAWFIQSEKVYQKRIYSYYKNVDIGNNYSKLNYDLCLPFLLMLPMALKIK